MKKLLLCCLVMLSLTSINAQVSNPGFENINTQNTGPDRWGPSEYIVIPIDSNCSWTGQDSMSFWSWDAHSGNRSYEIRVATFCIDGYSGVLQSRMFFVDTFADQRVPFSGRPDSFTFYYKFESHGGDFVNASVRLELIDGSIIGYGGVVIDQSAPGWIMGTMPMVYSDTFNPDYIKMYFEIQNDTDVNYGSRFVIDDINAVYPTSVAELMNTKQLQCFPVPAKDVVNISLPEIDSRSGKLAVIDALGKMVLEQELQINASNIEIRVGDLLPGIYSLKLSTPTNIFTARFVK